MKKIKLNKKSIMLTLFLFAALFSAGVIYFFNTWAAVAPTCSLAAGFLSGGRVNLSYSIQNAVSAVWNTGVVVQPFPAGSNEGTAGKTYTITATSAEGLTGSCSVNTQAFVTTTPPTSPPPPTPNYSLGVAVVPAGSGSVAKSPNANTYVSGSVVVLAASPASGFRFTQWSGCSTSTSAQISVTMTGPKSCTANFAAVPAGSYNVTGVASPSSGGKVSGSGVVALGGSKTLTATPSSGYLFKSWSGDCSGPNRSFTLTNVQAHKSCTANFSKNTVPVVYSPPSPATTSARNVAVDTEAPKSPKIVTVEYQAEKSAVYLEWEEATDNIGVVGYEAQRRVKGTAEWSKIEENVTGLNYLDNLVAAEKIYEYQVRAFDATKNYSEWSEAYEVSTGAFVPNIKALEGGTVTSEDGKVTVEFDPESLSEDVFISIRPVILPRLEVPKGYRLVGSSYEVQAKNNKGEEVTEFLKPIRIAITPAKEDYKPVKFETSHMGTSSDAFNYERVESSYRDGTFTAETSKLASYYMISAQKQSGFLTFLKYFLIFVLVVLLGGAPFAYIYLKRKKSEAEYQATEEELKY